MKLLLSNVGKIGGQSEIEINGITVLAGPNGTGKSTIGKMLFCIFDTFYNYENQIVEEKIKSIRRLLRMNRSRYRRIVNLDEMIIELIDTSSEDNLSKVIEEWLERYFPENEGEILEDLKERIERTLLADKQEVLTAMLSDRFSNEFNSQVSHVNCINSPSDIVLNIKDDSIRINISNSDKVKILSEINLTKKIIYIDDPNILNELEPSVGRLFLHNHKYSLLRLLSRRFRADLSAVDDVIIDDRVKKIEEKFNNINLGELFFSNDSGYRYKDSRLKEGVSIENLSMGLKSYVILKILIEKGVIEDNGLLVLDEPEIHLHPEWMRIYAEIVVLLQIEFDLNIVISTHSSDFLGFLELYTRKYNSYEKCKFYLLHNEEEHPEFSVIEDTTDNLDAIYSMLGKPFIEASEELEGLYEVNGNQ